jgi:hypothetical protein
MVAVTKSLAVFITLTEFDPELATNTFVPSELIDKPNGADPTIIVSETVFVAVLIL